MDQNNITTVHCKKFVHVSWSEIFCCGFCTSWFHPTPSGITNQGLFHPNWVYWSDCPGANEAMLTNASRLMTWIQKSLMVLTLFALYDIHDTSHKICTRFVSYIFSGSFCWVKYSATGIKDHSIIWRCLVERYFNVMNQVTKTGFLKSSKTDREEYWANYTLYI